MSWEAHGAVLRDERRQMVAQFERAEDAVFAAQLRARLANAEAARDQWKQKSEDLAAKLTEAERERDGWIKLSTENASEAAALRAERDEIATRFHESSAAWQDKLSAAEKRESRLREALTAAEDVIEQVKNVSDGECEFCQCATHEAILERIGIIVVEHQGKVARASLSPAAEVMRSHGFPEPSPEAQAAELLADSAAEAPVGESLTDAIRSLPGELRKEFRAIDDEARARRAGETPGRFVDNMTVPDPPGLLDTPAPIPAEATGELDWSAFGKVMGPDAGTWGAGCTHHKDGKHRAHYYLRGGECECGLRPGDERKG